MRKPYSSAEGLLLIDANPALEDVEAIREAWEVLGEAVPARIEALLDVGRSLDAVLALAYHVIGREALVRWRIEFTTEGGPYGATLFVRREVAGGDVEVIVSHNDVSLTRAFAGAVLKARKEA